VTLTLAGYLLSGRAELLRLLTTFYNSSLLPLYLLVYVSLYSLDPYLRTITYSRLCPLIKVMFTLGGISVELRGIRITKLLLGVVFTSRKRITLF
jgi:hypothetical protein